MTTKKDEGIIEGIILDADYGFGMKYRDEENLYLKLRIQQFDGYDCIQLFGRDKIAKLLLQYRDDYRGEVSCNTLRNRRIYLIDEMVNGMPRAVAKLPPSEYQQYEWIENDNWN